MSAEPDTVAAAAAAAAAASAVQPPSAEEQDEQQQLDAELFGEENLSPPDPRPMPSPAAAAAAPTAAGEGEAQDDAAAAVAVAENVTGTDGGGENGEEEEEAPAAAAAAVAAAYSAPLSGGTFSIPKKHPIANNTNNSNNALASPSKVSDVPRSPRDPRLHRAAAAGAAAAASSSPGGAVRKGSDASTLGLADTAAAGAAAPDAALPDGLIVPDSARELINGRIRGMLAQLPIDQMNAALQEFDDAATRQNRPIRSRGGYLAGVIRRYLALQERVSRGGDEAVGKPMGNELTPAVKEAIQMKLLATNFCTELDLDDKVATKMKMLPERDALAAIEEISAVNRASIRNFPSYFMGILNRYMRGERDGDGGRNNKHGDGRRGGDDHRGRYRDDRYRDDRRDGRYGRDRSPDYDRRRDDRRGGDRDRYGGRDDDRSRYGRDRSRSPDRDRYGGGGGSRDRHGDRHRYRSRSRSRSPSPYGRERKYSRDDGGNKRQSRWGSTSQQPTRAAQPIPQPGLTQYGPPAARAAIPPPPPPRTYAPPAQQPVGVRTFPSAAQQQVPGAPPAMMYGQPVGVVPQPAPAPGVYGSAVPLPGMMPNANPSLATMTYGQQPPMAGIPQVGTVPGQYGQAPAPAPPAAAVPVPGLDLASLASQAQQALSSIHGQALPGLPPTAAPPAPYNPAPASTQPQQHQQFSRPPAAASASAQVVTEKDLPMMVQYSLTNLKTTGHIDGQLDPGVCAMLQRLPEPLALSALQKFQSCEISSMRNKNAYLAGIIKRKREEGVP